MKKLAFTFFFFSLWLAAFSQTEIKNNPELAETHKKDSVHLSLNNNTLLQESSPASEAQKNQSEKSPNKSGDKKPILAESGNPKRID